MELTNFDTFGYREINIAGKLLQAYADYPRINKDGLAIGLNQNSGNVYLYNAEGECAMLTYEGKLEQWHTTPHSGHEGFLSDLQEMDKTDWDQDDIDYINELS